MSATKIWRLRAKQDQRFRSGHPWVYSNELQESPKGIAPGDPIELQDAGGRFLARGYGNPSSLIAFRALSRDASVERPESPEEIGKKLLLARELRARAGLAEWSYRLCHGEADGLPGLVIDRYRTGDSTQVLVAQLHTAGMDRLAPDLLAVLEPVVRATGIAREKTAILLDNDLPVRRLEGLSPEEPRLLRQVEGLDLSRARIRVAPALPESRDGFVEFAADLAHGQKTGFFLDQSANIQLAALRLRALPGPRLRILDLCCYVGQWGAQLARVFRTQGREVEVVAVDASAAALERARANIEAQGARCETRELDVLAGLGELEGASFDLVVCDPPALIKARKDLPKGTHAYLQLNTQVFRLIRRGGAVVTCSCSGLLEHEAFEKLLSKAAYRNGVSTRWIAHGGQGPDHPFLLEFPEGRYLKCLIGLVG